MIYQNLNKKRKRNKFKAIWIVAQLDNVFVDMWETHHFRGIIGTEKVALVVKQMDSSGVLVGLFDRPAVRTVLIKIILLIIRTYVSIVQFRSSY